MDALAEVGRNLAAQGQIEAARTVFEALCALEPRDADAHCGLATLYTRLARFEAAMAEYAVALGLNPRHVLSLANRGELRLLRGDAGGAMDLEAAVAADPTARSAGGRRALLRLSQLRHRPDRASRGG